MKLLLFTLLSHDPPFEKHSCVKKENKTKQMNKKPQEVASSNVQDFSLEILLKHSLNIAVRWLWHQECI